MPKQYTFLTVDDIITAATSEAINSSSSQLAAVGDTQLTTFVKWMDNYFRGLPHTMSDSGEPWSWLIKTKPYQTYNSTTLALACSAGDATFKLTAPTNWPSASRVAIRTVKGSLDFVDYSALNTGTKIATVSTASGAEAIDLAHLINERVNLLYAIPSDMERMLALVVDSYPPFEQSTKFEFPVFGSYRQLDAYFLLPYNLTASELTVWYEKSGNTITDRNSTTNIPFDAMRWAVEMCLFHLFRIRRKREDLKVTQELIDEYIHDFLTKDQLLSSETLMQFQ